MKLFSATRLRLTIWYAFTITLVSLFFSFTIFRIQTTELARFEELQRQRIESRLNTFASKRLPLTLIVDQDLIADTRSRLLMRLGIINGVIIVLSTGLGYVLAGHTLNPIQEMVEEQSRFISDASHELRTPLTALRTSLEVFLRGKKKNIVTAKVLIRDNLTEVTRLQNLSDSLLSLTRADCNFQFTAIDLKQVINSSLKSLKPIVDRRRIKIVSRLKALSVKGDHDQLVQLFTILIDNSLKYTPEGGKVLVSMKLSGKNIVVTIRDSGIGISKEDIPHIFDRFYRADSARIRKGQGGYGLGLSIAKQIIDSHHAKIIVNSKPSKGTTIQLIFRSIS